MNEISTWFESGGTVMFVLTGEAMVLAFFITERFLATRKNAATVNSNLPAGLSGMRRMGIIRACIAIAPMLGLLGTVSGIIETFQSILYGGYIIEMSSGICKALLTTQYGLAIAVPALICERLITRRMERLNSLAQAASEIGVQ